MEEEGKVVVQLLKNEDIRQFYKSELRSLELAAFSILLSALRAQGGLTEKRKEVIGSVKVALNISDDRHKAEIRRVAGDERLCKIAERLVGDSGCLDWNATGYGEPHLFPPYLQYPIGDLCKPRVPAVFSSLATPTVDIRENISPPSSPIPVEEVFDSNRDGERFENGWTSDSEVEAEFAQRVVKVASDTDEQKKGAAKARTSTTAVSPKKRRKSDATAIRKQQTSPDITAMSPSRSQQSPAKFKKPNMSPNLIRKKRKMSIPVKSLPRKMSNTPAKSQPVNSPRSPENCYPSVSTVTSNAELVDDHGQETRISPNRVSVRGRGGRGTRGSRKAPSATPIRRRKQQPPIFESNSTTVLGEIEMQAEMPKPPAKQRRKTKQPVMTDETPRKITVSRKKKVVNPNGNSEVNVNGIIAGYHDSQMPNSDKGIGISQHTYDGMSIDASLQCHESINSPIPQEPPDDDESMSIANNNFEHFGHYEETRREFSVPPAPAAPIKPPRARAKSEVPAKMRHKATKHMFNHEDRQYGFQHTDSTARTSNPNPPSYSPPTNSLSHFSSNNFYNELQMTPGLNPPVGIRPRQILNPISSSPNFGFASIPSNLQFSRSPLRNVLPTPVFSTTLNSNMHKKRTQVLLPSTYQTQLSGLGETGLDSSAATASSLAVAARNRTGLGLYDQQRQGIGLNISPVRPIAPIPQRKAQPHILSSSKLHRPLPTPPVPVSGLTSATSGTSVIPSSSLTSTAAVPLETVVTTSGSTEMDNTELTSTNVVQVPVVGDGGGNNVNSLPGVTNSVTLPSVQNIHTSLQNYQTVGVSSAATTAASTGVLTAIPPGLGVNVVRGQGGSNIIFLQKTSAPISGSGGTLPVVTPVNTTTLPPAVQVPAKNTSRAVILRRGNISRTGNLMFVDVHKNQVLGSSQVPQLLQTAHIISGPSDLAMLNMPGISTSCTGAINMNTRKLIPTSSVGTFTSAQVLPTYVSNANTITSTFRTVNQLQHFTPTKGIQVLAPSSVAGSVEYVTKLANTNASFRPIIAATPVQQIHSIPSSIYVPGSSGGVESAIVTPMNLVHFENDIVHEEEVNTTAFIESPSSPGNNVTVNIQTSNKNGDMMNSSNSSVTDTASEGENYGSPSPKKPLARHGSTTNVPVHQLREAVTLERLALPGSLDIFQTALKSSGIDLTASNMENSEPVEDKISHSSSLPSITTESYHPAAQFVTNVDTSGAGEWDT